MTELIGPDWEKYKMLQVLQNASVVHTLEQMIEPGALDDNDDQPRAEEKLQPHTHTGALDPIPEEPSEGGSDNEDMYLALEANLKELEEMQMISREQLQEEALPSGVQHRPTSGQIYVTGEPPEEDLREVDSEGQRYVKMLFPGDTSKLIMDGPIPEGHTAALLIYSTHAKKEVVETDQDLLTKDEYRTHAKDVIAAIRDELLTWIDHQCFRRRSRKGAYNIVDVRWVGKW